MATPPKAGSEPIGVRVEVSKFKIAVGDSEDVMLTLGECDVISGDIGREKERLVSPLDSAARINEPDKGALGIDDCRKARGIAPRGGSVEMRRRLMFGQTLVWPLGVVLALEVVESFLP